MTYSGQIDTTVSLRALSDRRYVAYHVVCILLMPVALLAINPNLFINPGGNAALDPWVYTGLFISFPAHLQRFGETYYSSRLPWTLPGFVAHRLFSALTANYVLHLSFFCVLLLATYRLVTRGINRSAGFIAAVLVGGSPTILVALSWDYTDGAGIVFLVVTLCCLNEAATDDRGRALWALAAGSAMACLVASNLTLMLLLPACGAFLMVRAPAMTWRSRAWVALLAIVGAAATLALLGISNRSLGGQMRFWVPSIRFAQVIRSTPNPWKTAGFHWNRATWLVLPVYAGIGAVVFFCARLKRTSSFNEAAQFGLLVALVTWALVDTVADSALLQFPYYTSYLAPLALVALVAQAGPPPDTDSLFRTAALEIAIVGMIMIGHLLSLKQSAVLWMQLAGWFGLANFNLMTIVALATILPGLLAVLALHLIQQPHLRWGLFVIMVIISFSAVPEYWPTANAPNGPLQFDATVRAHRFIAAEVRDGRAMRIWSVPSSSESPPLQSIAATFLYGPVLVNIELPRLTAAEASMMPPNTHLVLLVRRQSDADAARAAMRAFGLDYAVVSQRQFGPDRQSFVVVVADVVPASSPS